MAEFEEKVREAFEAELSRGRAREDLRHRVIQKATLEPRRRKAPTTRWGGPRFVLALSAAAAAVVLVAGGSYAIFHKTQTTIAQHSPSPSGPVATRAFGSLPAPRFEPPVGLGGGGGGSGPLPYYGPANLSWSGKFPKLPGAVPVYRSTVPDRAAEDTFAASLGGRPTTANGALGPGRQWALKGGYLLFIPQPSPGSPPGFSIMLQQGGGPPPEASVPDSVAIGAAQAFLNQYGLTPTWESRTLVTPGAQGSAFVEYQRLFDIGGGGKAGLVDTKGDPDGLQVVVEGTQVAQVNGYLSGSLEKAFYALRSQNDAVQSALHSAPEASPEPSQPTPAVSLSQVNLVYQLVSTGGYEYFVPAYYFTGTFSSGESEKRVLIPASE
jgi:hypothetical protein